jgi:hypothetical protein
VNAFDYLFTFYGLLLGIAVANVAIGFADMWRDCGKFAVGYCPPLLGVIVMLGGMNVWLTMWHVRADVTVGAWQMLAATGVAMPYVFVSRAMFPGAERETELSLEDHYLRHRVLILLVLALPPIVSLASKIMLDRVRDHGWDLEWIVARTLLPLMLIPLKGRDAQRAGLGAFATLELIGLFRT